MEQYHVIEVLRLGLRASKVPVLFFENKFINFLAELVSSVVSTFPWKILIQQRVLLPKEHSRLD
jgi:hypothetical protein